MVRAGQRVRAGREPGLPDRVAIGVLTAAYPPDMVDAAVDTCDARELRRRDLPARLVTLEEFPAATPNAGSWRPRSARWRPGCAAALTYCCARNPRTWSARRSTPCSVSIRRSAT
ncbi:hypothetical protein E1292_16950 [Nonomuraea deserti]|uniref:Transposase IS4 N-terminal domain-containing protein n=1 Tax=Nonomuraea deserti TaxID=1848322 RepID=A0A4R4VYF2_9ACTN|nr:hypothetical protein E1292_16950 [Nonomuraea deserti]